MVLSRWAPFGKESFQIILRLFGYHSQCHSEMAIILGANINTVLLQRMATTEHSQAKEK